jgi:hypothetical protein
MRITTTNGLERKHQEFKRGYLSHYSEGSLCTMISTLVLNFLPDSYRRYACIDMNLINMYICQFCHCFLLYNAVTSNAYLSPHRYISGSIEVTAKSQYKHVVTDRVKFQHFVGVLNILIKNR